MGYGLLSIATVLFASQSVIAKKYNQANEGYTNVANSYNMLFIFAGLVFYSIYSLFDFQFHLPTLYYSIAFAGCFLLTNIGMLVALKTGPLSLTSLFVQLSILLTVIYGFIFWNEPVSIFSIIALVLIFVALALCLYKKTGQNDSERVNFKWTISIAICVVANASCMVLQKTQQLAYEGQYKSTLMLFASLFAFVVAVVIYLVTDKIDYKTLLLKTSYYPLTAGLCNAGVNTLMMALALILSSKIVYPVISVGGLILVQVISIALYKEKLRKLQYAGILLGIAAIVLINF